MLTEPNREKQPSTATPAPPDSRWQREGLRRTHAGTGRTCRTAVKGPEPESGSCDSCSEHVLVPPVKKGSLSPERSAALCNLPASGSPAAVGLVVPLYCCSQRVRPLNSSPRCSPLKENSSVSRGSKHPPPPLPPHYKPAVILHSARGVSWTRKKMMLCGAGARGTLGLGSGCQTSAIPQFNNWSNRSSD